MSKGCLFGATSDASLALAHHRWLLGAALLLASAGCHSSAASKNDAAAPGDDATPAGDDADAPGGDADPTEALPWTETPVTVQVVAPDGFTLPLSSLQAQTFLGPAAVGTDGSATLTVFDGGPQLAVVTTPEGNPVLAGWIGPARTTIDATTTAQVMAFYFAGAYLQAPEIQVRILQALEAAPELADVRAAVAQSIVKAPQGLAVDPAVTAALGVAYPKLLRSFRSAKIEPNTISPGGVEVQLGDGNSVVVVNHKRRRVRAFVDLVGSTEDRGTPIMPLVPAVSVGDVEISPVTGVTSVFGTIGDLLSGKVAYAEVRSAPLSVPPVNKSKSGYTQYRVRTVGLGVDAGDEAKLSADQKIESELTQVYSVMFDIVAPALFSAALPLGKCSYWLKTGEKLELPAAFGEVAKQLNTTGIKISDKVTSPDFKKSPGATLLQILGLVGAEMIKNENLRKAMWASMAEVAFNGCAHTKAVSPSKLVDNFEKFFFASKWLSVGAQVIDTVVQFMAIAGASRADTFDVQVTTANVRLNPFTKDTTRGADPITLKVATPGLEDRTGYSYRWMLLSRSGAPALGKLYVHDAAGDHSFAVPQLCTESDVAAYFVGSEAPLLEDTAEIPIVEVFSKPGCNNADSIGSGLSTITVKLQKKAVLSINPGAIGTNDSASLHVAVLGADVTGATYRWKTAPGVAGTLTEISDADGTEGRAGTTYCSTSASARFKSAGDLAGMVANELILVDVFDGPDCTALAGGTPIASASGEVEVHRSGLVLGQCSITVSGGSGMGVAYDGKNYGDPRPLSATDQLLVGLGNKCVGKIVDGNTLSFAEPIYGPTYGGPTAGPTGTTCCEARPVRVNLTMPEMPFAPRTMPMSYSFAGQLTGFAAWEVAPCGNMPNDYAAWVARNGLGPIPYGSGTLTITSVAREGFDQVVHGIFTATLVQADAKCGPGDGMTRYTIYGPALIDTAVAYTETMPPYHIFVGPVQMSVTF
jgi:hypothetical protein